MNVWTNISGWNWNNWYLIIAGCIQYITTPINPKIENSLVAALSDNNNIVKYTKTAETTNNNELRIKNEIGEPKYLNKYNV